VARLQPADAAERFCFLTGAPVLGVDLRAVEGAPSRDELTVARRALARLPSPSVAIAGADDHPDAASLRAAFDVVVADTSGYEEVRDASARSPRAALGLVQLTRVSDARSVDEGLIAESLVYGVLQSGPRFTSWLAERKPPGAGAQGTQATPPVLVRRAETHLRLTLNRPERRNAFSAEMRDALCEALQLVADDDGILEVVLDGAGPAFCSGGDLAEFGTLPDPATAHAIRSVRSPARLIADCAPRLRVMVHGACVGAGIELPAFAGRVVASRDAWFALPEVAMGLVPGAGGTVSLPRRIGAQRTAWLALTGRRIDAETALAWGLVDELR